MSEKQTPRLNKLRACFVSLVDGLPVALLSILVVTIFLSARLLLAQTQPLAPGASQISDLIPNSHNPWFYIFIAWYVFSALVTGMPEPTVDSSPWYIWAYRSFHILAASGTSFFQNKIYWPTGMQKPPQDTVTKP